MFQASSERDARALIELKFDGLYKHYKEIEITNKRKPRAKSYELMCIS